MKKILKIFLFGILGLILAGSVSAQIDYQQVPLPLGITPLTTGQLKIDCGPQPNGDYILCEPLPGLETQRFGGIADLFSVLYRYAVLLGGLVVFARILYGGLIYIFNAGNVEKQSDAREVITKALIGLGLLMGSFVILYTINPELVTLEEPKGVEPVRLEKVEGLFEKLLRTSPAEEQFLAANREIARKQSEAEQAKLNAQTLLNQQEAGGLTEEEKMGLAEAIKEYKSKKQDAIGTEINKVNEQIDQYYRDKFSPGKLITSKEIDNLFAFINQKINLKAEQDAIRTINASDFKSEGEIQVPEIAIINNKHQEIIKTIADIEAKKGLYGGISPIYRDYYIKRLKQSDLDNENRRRNL